MHPRWPSPVLRGALAIGLVVAAQAEATPPEPNATPVSVGYMYVPHEWQLTLGVTPPVKEIFVALGDGEFVSTGFLTAVSGQKIANPLMMIPDVSQRIRVRLVTTAGKTLGPFPFAFDRDKEVVGMFKRGLEENKREWLSFREYPPGHWLVNFAYLAPKTCGIREARYSIDSDALDQVIPLPACDLKEPYAAPFKNYNPIKDLAQRPGVARVQVLYADGTRSEVVTLRP
jgi:hypothetical protein